MASCQFGERADFALEWSAVPAADGAEANSPTWGSLRVWALGQCITEAFLPAEPGQRATPEPLTWAVGPLATWLRKNAAVALQEEAFPFGLLDEAADASAWLADSRDFARKQTPQDEDRLWHQRSLWQDRHVPSRALIDAATPQWTLRRLGDRVELTWDTAPARAIRPDIGWVAPPQGCVYLDGPRCAAVLSAFADQMVTDPADGPALPLSSKPAWHWLVSPAVRGVVDADAALAQQIVRSVELANQRQVGWWWQHSLPTWLLRNLPADTPGASKLAVERLLALTSTKSQTSLVPKLQALRVRVDDTTTTPFRVGYERAQQVRAELYPTSGPIPSVAKLLAHYGADVRSVTLGARLDSVVWTDANAADRATVALPRSPLPKRPRPAMAAATALGHLLMDSEPGMDWAQTAGDGTDWYTGSRARGFAIMFLMPEHEVRKVIGRRRVTPAVVQQLCQTYDLGVTAVTWHLHNLGIIGREQRVELAAGAWLGV